MLGAGGKLGSLTFGFLQRSSSLFETGVGKVRALGATANTASRLNSFLARHFCLAFADESVIKLTNLEDIEAISSRLDGWDALIWGTDVDLAMKPVTGNTFESKPNQQTMEVYWDAKSDSTEVDIISKQKLVDNILAAAKNQGLGHMVVVDDGSVPDLLPQLQACSVPFTCIQPLGVLNDIQAYTYREGVQAELTIETGKELEIDGAMLIPREDVAALAVECLQSLDWSKSRCIQVSCPDAKALDVPENASGKRPDQEWCVNSWALRRALRAEIGQPA